MSQLGCRQALSLLVAAVVLLEGATGVLLPIVALPVSFNFGGASPMSKEVQCSYGTSLEFDGSQHQRAKPGCGAARYAWKVVAESGAGTAGGSEIPLGPAASQQKLSLTLAPARGPGAAVADRRGRDPTAESMPRASLSCQLLHVPRAHVKEGMWLLPADCLAVHLMHHHTPLTHCLICSPI